MPAFTLAAVSPPTGYDASGVYEYAIDCDGVVAAAELSAILSPSPAQLARPARLHANEGVAVPRLILQRPGWICPTPILRAGVGGGPRVSLAAHARVAKLVDARDLGSRGQHP